MSKDGDRVFEDVLRGMLESSRVSRSVRACLIATRDREHALVRVRQVGDACELPVHHYGFNGRRRWEAADRRWIVVASEPSDAARLLEQAASVPRGIVVLEDCARLLHDATGDGRMRARLAELLADATSDGLVVAFLDAPEAEGQLPAMLAAQITRLDVDYPTRSEIEELVRLELAADSHRSGRRLSVPRIQTEAPRLAAALVGLTRSAARDGLRDALALDGADLGSVRSRLDGRKSDLLGRELAMSVMAPGTEADEPVGLENLVEYFRMARPRMRQSGPGRARGALLIGPPGTGKTMLARAAGRLSGLPVVEFRVSSLMQSLLGETERRFAQAFATLAAMAPNIVFIDELEKVFGDSSERDGGTMMRCTGALLSWLSDNPHPNFIVATCNSLARMGDIGLTMTRSERFDTAFFVDVPSLAARRQMLERWLAGALPEWKAAAGLLARRTERFSGADLFSALKQARWRCEAAQEPLALGHLEMEIERKRPRVEALHAEFEPLRQWAARHCEPASAQS